jgi:ribose 1,5-bisphosphokinase
MPAGTLVLIVGPSGAGKDSLIRHAMAELAEEPDFVFPRRVVTRPPDENESHDEMSPEAFEKAREDGQFALSWTAHGSHYGIPRSIDTSLKAGKVVAVNVSRTVLDEAMRTYPRLVALLVTAPAALLAERLALRGREDCAAVNRRVARPAPPLPPELRVIEIANAGSFETAARRFSHLLRDIRTADHWAASHN